jgi:hypothetical protein
VRTHLRPAGWPARAARPELPLPLLLVMEPTFCAWPWSAAVPHAASTLQSRGAAGHLEAPGVHATLAFAVECQRVETVVLCGQGPWAAAGAATLAPLAAALREALGRLCAGTTPPPPVEALWLEPPTGMLHALGSHPVTGALSASAPPSAWLQQLLEALEGRRARHGWRS